MNDAAPILSHGWPWHGADEASDIVILPECAGVVKPKRSDRKGPRNMERRAQRRPSSCEAGEPLRPPSHKSPLDDDVLILDPAEVLHPALEFSDESIRGLAGGTA